MYAVLKILSIALILASLANATQLFNSIKNSKNRQFNMIDENNGDQQNQFLQDRDQMLNRRIDAVYFQLLKHMKHKKKQEKHSQANVDSPGSISAASSNSASNLAPSSDSEKQDATFLKSILETLAIFGTNNSPAKNNGASKDFFG